MNDQLNKRLCYILIEADKRGWDDVRLWIGHHIDMDEQAAKTPRKRKVRLGSGSDKVRGGDFYVEPGKLKGQ